MGERSASVDAIIAATPDWRGHMLARLRDLIHEADPDIAEEAKWKRPTNPLGSPVFEHDGLVCTLAVLKGRVRLTLSEGASLPDPHGLYNAALDAGHMRGIDIHEGEEVDEDAVKDLVRAAVELNRSKPSKKKSK